MFDFHSNQKQKIVNFVCEMPESIREAFVDSVNKVYEDGKTPKFVTTEDIYGEICAVDVVLE